MCDFVTTQEVIDKYNNIENQFKAQCVREGLFFDIDVYYDTVLKSFLKLAPQGIDDINDAKDYLWKAFKSNTLREQRYSRNKLRDAVEICDIHIEDEQYDDSLDDWCQEIMLSISDEFGEENAMLFQSHVGGKTYEELHKASGKKPHKLHETFRNIRNFIRKKYKRK